jgi:hypothetical protein
MFSSFTLADRNNDPEPYVDRDGRRQNGLRPVGYWSTQGSRLAPRPEFQYGIVPGNPILVAFRKNGNNSVMWADLDRTPTDEERAHASRVLHLRATLMKVTK